MMDHVKNNTNVLMLTGSLAIDGSNYTCLVDSSQLYSPIKKNITHSHFRSGTGFDR